MTDKCDLHDVLASEIKEMRKELRQFINLNQEKEIKASNAVVRLQERVGTLTAVVGACSLATLGVVVRAAFQYYSTGG